nr:ABATE domain-containing protein [Nocardia sienata]
MHDQPPDPFRVALGEPEADRSAEVEDIHGETAQAELLSTPDQLADWLRQQADRLPENPPENLTAEALREVQQVRDHISTVLEALLSHRPPPAAALAESAVELLSDPAIARLKQCEADDCVLLFIPAAAGARHNAAATESA